MTQCACVWELIKLQECSGEIPKLREKKKAEVGVLPIKASRHMLRIKCNSARGEEEKKQNNRLDDHH